MVFLVYPSRGGKRNTLKMRRVKFIFSPVFSKATRVPPSFISYYVAWTGWAGPRPWCSLKETASGTWHIYSLINGVITLGPLLFRPGHFVLWSTATCLFRPRSFRSQQFCLVVISFPRARETSRCPYFAFGCHWVPVLLLVISSHSCHFMCLSIFSCH
jgi:hypothetical protein